MLSAVGRVTKVESCDTESFSKRYRKRLRYVSVWYCSQTDVQSKSSFIPWRVKDSSLCGMRVHLGVAGFSA